MRAAVVPAAGARWEVHDVPVPEPASTQVLVRVRASGLCYTDITHSNGAPGSAFPLRPGHEIAGEVVAVGDAVTKIKLGDRVGVGWLQATCGCCSACTGGHGFFCPSQIDTSRGVPGGHADYMVAHAEGAVAIPDGVSFEQAAPLFCAGFTVWGGLRDANPEPGETIAIQGVGGLGHLGIQYAKSCGFRTVAVTRSPEKQQIARELGADEVVACGSELREAGGANILLYTGNGYGALDELLEGMSLGARIVLLGLAFEPIVITKPLRMFAGGKRLICSTPSRWQHLYEVLQMAAQGKVRAMVETFGLDDVTTVAERVRNAEIRFRAVIIP